MKQFKYGAKVRVTLPGKKSFTGTVYSEYKDPNRMRRICVERKNGAGVAYPVMYVKGTA